MKESQIHGLLLTFHLPLIIDDKPEIIEIRLQKMPQGPDHRSQTPTAPSLELACMTLAYTGHLVRIPAPPTNQQN